MHNIYLSVYRHMLTYRTNYIQDAKYKHLMSEKIEFERRLTEEASENSREILKSYVAVIDELLAYVIEVSNQFDA